MSFLLSDYYQNLSKPRTLLYSKGGNIKGNINQKGNINFNGGIYGNIDFNGNLDMSLNKVNNVGDLIFNDNEVYYTWFYRNDETSARCYIWYEESQEWLRLGSGAGVTSWTIDLRDTSNTEINNLALGFNGVDKTSIFAINYDHAIPRFSNSSNKNLLRLQTSNTDETQLLYTRTPLHILSVGNSYEDVSNNGGYRLDISGNGYLRGDTLKIKTPRTIANSSSIGTKGEICWDTNYLYICINDNTWSRLSLTSW